MFCKNCGCKLHESMHFCYSCGMVLQEEAALQAERSAQDYDLDAIKLYLKDLQTLELIRYRLKQDIMDLDVQVASLGKPGRYTYRDQLIYGIDDEEKFVQCNDVDKTFHARIGKWVWAGLVCILLLACAVAVCWWKSLFSPLVFNAMLGTVGAICVAFIWAAIFVSQRLRRNAKAEKHEFLKFKAVEEERLNCEEAEKLYLQKHRTHLCKEYEEAEKLLQRSYAPKIIPTVLHNISSIYYLSNVVANSQEPFSKALERCLSSKGPLSLNEIAVQKSGEILKAASLQGQNREWECQINDHLQSLLLSEEESEKADKYYQIAIVHAQVVAWLSLCDCLSEDIL